MINSLKEQRMNEQDHVLPLQIAIDGPVGSGKSDISTRLAQDKELGLTYINTGSMYRALTLACIKESVSFNDKDRVTALLEKYTIDFESHPESKRTFKIHLNGEDVTEELYQPMVDKGVSDVSAIAQVRQLMVKKQQEIAHSKPVVMEGRDIATRVLPDAQLKIYLNASVEVRANRRWQQYQKEGKDISYEEVYKDTLERDRKDTTREVDPLQKHPDAIELDTTDLNQEEVVERIKTELQERHLI